MTARENVGRIRLEPGWKALLDDQFTEDYMVRLRAFLVARMQAGAVIYPATDQWFAAFDATPLDRVQVVIIGQDPYHGPKQAHGLCFSVRAPTPPPPSLQNIFKEIAGDLPLATAAAAACGDLTRWAQQGVLLLNSVLTVERGKAGSHKDQGWEVFTDCVVNRLAMHKKNLVFMLWGNYAQRKGEQIDRQQHLVLSAPHPSPFSAHSGFFGRRHFSACNTHLTGLGQDPINWHHLTAPSD